MRKTIKAFIITSMGENILEIPSETDLLQDYLLFSDHLATFL